MGCDSMITYIKMKNKNKLYAIYINGMTQGQPDSPESSDSYSSFDGLVALANQFPIGQ